MPDSGSGDQECKVYNLYLEAQVVVATRVPYTMPSSYPTQILSLLWVARTFDGAYPLTTMSAGLAKREQSLAVVNGPFRPENGVS